MIQSTESDEVIIPNEWLFKYLCYLTLLFVVVVRCILMESRPVMILKNINESYAFSRGREQDLGAAFGFIQSIPLGVVGSEESILVS